MSSRTRTTRGGPTGRGSLILLLAAGSFAAASAARADSISCDGGIVSVGDSKVDLLGKCGKPALVEERLGWQWYPSGQRAIVTAEVWTYNFGPNRFLQYVTLVDGKVTQVERGGYGYSAEQVGEKQEPGRARCDPSALRIGDGKLDLLAKCGEPASRESRLEKRATGPDGAAWTAVQVDVWTYDFGPQRFIQFVTLENGKIVTVERGGYGYAR